MKLNQFNLFKKRAFLPLFIAQFTGCFNDCLMKNAIIILIAYKLSESAQIPYTYLILLVNASFVIPFIIFAGITGQICDKYERSTIVKIIRFCEIFIVLLSVYGFHKLSLPILFSAIWLMGIHSTFFGPLKYAILPDQIEKDELLSANGFVESGTFIGILFGTLIGGIYTSIPNLTLAIMITFSLVGFIASLYIPRSNNANPEIKINPNIIQEAINLNNTFKSRRTLFLSILANSWFWFVGGSFLSQIPILTKVTLGADESVANLFLITFSLGIGFGSMLCGSLLNREITMKYIFLAAFGMSLFGIDLFFATKLSAKNFDPDSLKNISSFLYKINNWRIVLDLFFFSMIGGIYVVPSYTVMQQFSPHNYRSRVISVNNIWNSIFMIISNLMLMVLFGMGVKVPYVILIVSIINLFVAWYIYKLTPDPEIIPEPLVRGFFKFIFDKLYKVEVRGMENFHNAGKRAVIIANHISYIDPTLIAIYLPERISFAINTMVAKKAWVKPFLNFVKTYPIDPSSPMGIKNLIKELRNNKKIVIFPEGRVSVTGGLMKIYEGPGAIAEKADAVILPIRIDGAQYTHFSKLKKLTKIRLFPKIIISILPAIKLDFTEEKDPKQKRKLIGTKLYDIMSQMIFETSDYKANLFLGLVDASKTYSRNFKIVNDINNTEMTYRQFILRSFILGRKFFDKNIGTNKSKYVGLMMPTSSVGILSVFAFISHSIVPAMINFTSGYHSIISSCQSIGINVIYTSRNFVIKASLQDLVNELKDKINIIYLEDVAKEISIVDKLRGFIASLFPKMYFEEICKNQNPDETAIVLFTSGTESSPKAVALSHKNIFANTYQVRSKLDLNNNDIAFMSLPIFHCFGLSGAIFTIFNGVHSFFYPSPLHYKVIPEYIYDVGATITFTTDTFLNMYEKFAHPYDFYSLRYVFAGAEKLKESTKKIWLDKFGIRVFEGYGATECSPVISINTSMYNKQNSVGRLVAGMEYKIEKVEGIEVGGSLLVRGPNVMKGYINKENSGIDEEGWYDTGDIVEVDRDGYITILGRKKRFAKIAGEMISLTSVEEIASRIDGSLVSGAISILDETRGEKIVLFTQSEIITRDEFIKEVKEIKISEMYIPKEIIQMKDIPVLATGKINYIELNRLYEQGINKE
jgi:acyl-[acyl-carrier-protein]-phospholipid O-acyltransferase / long-chain-fatty-acid--[acyl-carrier-protein] ligase